MESKISTFSAIMIITVAVVLDLAEILTDLIGIGVIISWIIYFPALLFFWLWFKLKGVNLVSDKNIKSSAIFAIIQLIPILSALPVWTALVIKTIMAEWAEEKLAGAKTPKDDKAPETNTNNETSTDAELS